MGQLGKIAELYAVYGENRKLAIEICKGLKVEYQHWFSNIKDNIVTVDSQEMFDLLVEEECENVYSLRINKVKDLSKLEKFTKLFSLELNNVIIEDKFLNSLQKLHNLVVKESFLDDFNNEELFINSLCEVSIENTNIQNVNFLSNCINITKLNISNNRKLNNIEGLKKMKNLTLFSCENTIVSCLNVITDKPIVALNIENSFVCDLVSLPKLKTLMAANTFINDIKLLGYNDMLFVDISHTDIVDINPLLRSFANPAFSFAAHKDVDLTLPRYFSTTLTPIE